MRKIFQLTALLVAIAAIVVSCDSPNREKTIKSLQDAITGETGATTKYQAFSVQAAENGYYNIAAMFAAASAAELVHINNHNAVLVKLGQEVFIPVIEEPVVNSTAENLQDGIEGETYEATVMYPEFIAIAKAEKAKEAITSFSWAQEAEAEHARLYAEALNILLMNGDDAMVAAEWYLCTKCGNLFNTIEGIESCPICALKSTSFEKF